MTDLQNINLTTHSREVFLILRRNLKKLFTSIQQTGVNSSAFFSSKNIRYQLIPLATKESFVAIDEVFITTNKNVFRFCHRESEAVVS